MAMEAPETLMYAKYTVACVIVVVSLCLIFAMVQRLADYLIGLITLGAISLVCVGIYNGNLSTWSEVATVSAIAGAGAGLICIPLLPFAEVNTKSAPQQSSHPGEVLQKVE